MALSHQTSIVPVMTSVSEQDGPQFSIGIVNPQDGDIVIDGAVRVWAVADSVLGRQPAVHGEARAGVAVTQLGWSEIVYRPTDQIEDFLLKVIDVLITLPNLIFCIIIEIVIYPFSSSEDPSGD